ncbi:MAG: hypothetical protein ACE5JP_10980 [Candidatus Bipolaricaulia bacterium]
MGVRDCFGRLYGPDLVDTLKRGPEYYVRIFTDVRVSPADALVIDDQPLFINWAAQAGAKTVLVGPAADEECKPGLIIASLAELPQALETIG